MSQSPPSSVESSQLGRLPRTSLVPARYGAPPVEHVVEVSEVVKMLRRHRRLILTFAAVFFLLGMTFTLLTRMRFESKARLYLGELENKNPRRSSEDEIDLSGDGREDLASEIEILRSTSLVTRAILDTGLNTVISLAGWSPPRYVTWLLSRRSVGLLDVSDQEVMAVDTSLTDRSAPAATFEVLFKSDVEYDVKSQGVSIGHGRLGDQVHCRGLSIRLVPGTYRSPKAGTSYQIEVLRLDDVLDATLKDLDISTPANKAPTTAGETFKIANLVFSHKSPRKAAGFLEHLINEYLEQRHAWKTENATAAESFITMELGKTREKLDDLQNKLAAYRTQHGVVVLDTEAKALLEQVALYEEQRVTARLEAESLASVNEQLSRPEPPSETYMMGEAKDDAMLMNLATGLAQTQQKLAEAETRYNGAAPEVRNLRAEIGAELDAIRNYVRARLSRARQSLRRLDGIVEQFDEKLRTVPTAEVGLAQLTRETEVYSALYSQLLKQQQQTALLKASSISKNRMLDAPQVPYGEQLTRLLIGLGSGPVGLILGVLVVLLRSVVSGRLQRPADVRKLSDVFVLATIPHASRRVRYASAEFVEAFRTLRASVMALCTRDRGNVVLFTSPCSGDGKTTCAHFLGWVLARGGCSVLLVDTGLRPRLKAGENPVAEGKAFADVLQGRERWQNVTERIAVLGEWPLDVIRGGSGESTDILSSGAMLRFVAEAREAYDFVLLEAPSYPAVADTLVLAEMADCVVAVLRIEHTSRALAIDSLNQLAGTARYHGLVLNDVTT
jgi:tyrosine-protein kinase Etk/Wzc